jgi:hypothetical protein
MIATVAPLLTAGRGGSLSGIESARDERKSAI